MKLNLAHILLIWENCRLLNMKSNRCICYSKHSFFMNTTKMELLAQTTVIIDSNSHYNILWIMSKMYWFTKKWSAHSLLLKSILNYVKENISVLNGILFDYQCLNSEVVKCRIKENWFTIICRDEKEIRDRVEVLKNWDRKNWHLMW